MPHFPRIHAFEWEDLRWFPSFLRDCMTDFLEHISHVSKIYRGVGSHLSKELNTTQKSSILDLASGGGGPWRQVLPELLETHPNAVVTLSDFYPNEKAFKRIVEQFPKNVKYTLKPLDARAVSEHANDIRTQFLSLHHFVEKDVVDIFKNAITAKTTLVIVEGQTRTLPSMIGMIFSPISALVLTPFIRPFRWDRILFTYLIPILPLLIMWDGMISVLRTYSEKELKNIASQADTKGEYNWEYHTLKGTPATVFIGRPSA